LRTNDLLNAVEYLARPDDSRELQRAFPHLLRAPQADDAPPAAGQQPGLPAHAAGPATEAAAAGPATAAAAAVAAAPSGGFLAGEAYYSAKEQLIWDEQVLLRVLRFQLCVEHPHRVLLNLCRALRCSAPLARLATCLVCAPTTCTHLQCCLHLTSPESG
jgi:hypothetical protein